MGYKSHAQRKAVWASKKDGGKGNPNSPAKMVPTSARKKRKTQQDIANEARKNRSSYRNKAAEQMAKYRKKKTQAEAAVAGGMSEKDMMRNETKVYAKMSSPFKLGANKKKKSEDMSKPRRQRTAREAVIGRVSDPISYDPKSKELKENPVPHDTDVSGIKMSPFKLKPKSPLMGKISAACKARAKKKFKVWPSAYASGWGVRCTQGKV